MADENPEAGEIHRELERQWESVRLACAVELANARRFKEAEKVLRANGREITSPIELDLLARMAGQQGRLGDARLNWEKALALAPEDKELKEALEGLNECVRGAGDRRQFIRALAMAIILAVGLLAAVRALFGAPDPGGQAKPGEAATPPATVADRPR